MQRDCNASAAGGCWFLFSFFSLVKDDVVDPGVSRSDGEEEKRADWKCRIR